MIDDDRATGPCAADPETKAGCPIGVDRTTREFVRARSMRDSGLDHAGFYAEVSTSWVNGFGSDTKLSLGDTTWSAGVDFEF